MRTVMDMAKNDEIETPIDALLPLLPYLNQLSYDSEQTRIWEMCPGTGKMINSLRVLGYHASDFGIKDSLANKPPWTRYDVIVTNPPWSKKHLYLERCQSLDRPFALLLPIRTLGVARCQDHMQGIDVLLLRRRVDFTGGGAPYEACAWFTRGLLPERMVFE